jgi:membrane associated rhomboid family serine protease
MLLLRLKNSIPRRRFFSSHSEYEQPVRRAGIVKHVIFAAGFTIFAFQASAHYHIHYYIPEQMEKMKKKAQKSYRNILKRAGIYDEDEQLDSNGYALKSDHQSTIWNRLAKRISVAAGTENWKLLGSIIAINAGVFMLWRGNPRIQSFMLDHFRSSAHFRHLHQHITSMFSHITLGHFAFNMFGLWTFGIPMTLVMTPHYFLSFYLSAGVCASVMTRAVHMITKTSAYSVGASHALYAVLALYACAFPDHQLNIIFLPMLKFSAADALTGIFLFDLCGLLFTVFARRSLFGFDHAAHLMGLTFGIAYFNYGRHLKERQLQTTFEEAQKRGRV